MEAVVWLHGLVAAEAVIRVLFLYIYSGHGQFVGLSLSAPTPELLNRTMARPGH